MRARVLTVLSMAICCMASMRAPARAETDVKQGIPKSAFLAVYAWQNPEREFQRAYFAEVWETVQDTEIIERVVKIITDQMEEDDLAQAKSVIDDVREAVAPIDFESLMDFKDLAYGQTMDFPQTHHVFLLRATEEDAKSMEEAVKNLFGLLEKATDGKVAVETETVDGADMVKLDLDLPEEVPMQPIFMRLADVVILATSQDLATESLKMLRGEGGESKFDDPRLIAALKKLPEPEDSLTFYDGALQMKQLARIPEMIREESGGDEDAERVAEFVDEVFEELAILDYEIAVEYTEENRNCRATLGKLKADAEGKMLTQVVGSGQPFEAWQRWVPATATAYSLNTGVNLLPLYNWIMDEVPEHFPEAEEGMEQFAAVQEQFDINLKEDFLEAFSGECVTITMPAEIPSPFGGQDSVLALRCQKPDRLRELLHRLVEVLQQNEKLQAQQIKLEPCDDLEGFEELSVVLLNSFGARPVIGFHEGWFMIGSNKSAIEAVMETQTGDAENIADTDGFQAFEMEIEGEVLAISYRDLAASTRQAAMLIQQVGMFVPAIIAMAGAEADPEDLQPLQEALGLLPSVARIVAKFDFLEKQITVTREGDEPLEYRRESVIMVRPPNSSQDG